MNDSEFKLEVFNKGLPDYRELYDFFKSHNFTRFSRNKFVEYMKCLFDNNPFGRGLQVVVKDTLGNMVGYNSMFSVPFLYNGAYISGGQVVNILMHKNFRKKGLFVKTARKLYESAEKNDINFIYGFPNFYALPGHQKVEGWNYKDLSFWITKISENSKFDIKNTYKPIKNFNEINFKNAGITKDEKKLFQVFKTFEYLNWRFITLGNFFKYDIYKISDNSGNFLGIVVFKEYIENQIKYGQIIDAVVPIYNLSIFDDLLNFYSNYYQNKKIFDLQFLLLSPPKIKDFLASRGFSSISKNLLFISRSNNQEYLDAIKSDKVLLYLSAKDNL